MATDAVIGVVDDVVEVVELDLLSESGAKVVLVLFGWILAFLVFSLLDPNIATASCYSCFGQRG